VQTAQDELDSDEDVKEKEIKFKTLQRPSAETLVDELSQDYKTLIKSQGFLSKISGWLLQ
jgi:hypothetical protein